MYRVRPVLADGRQANFLPFQGFQPQPLRAGFGKLGGSHADAEIIIQRPQAGVEEPVGVFAQGETVARIVVPAVGKAVDVRGVHNAAAIHRHQAVTGQGAGEGGKDGSAVPAGLDGFLRRRTHL
jgi:hypothetical protein